MRSIEDSQLRPPGKEAPGNHHKGLSEQCVRLLKEGDSATFERVFDRYAKPIAAYLERMTLSVDVEAIVQETFLRLWQKRKQYNPSKAGLSTWLHRIAYNLTIDAYRKTGKECSLSEDYEVAFDPELQLNRDSDLKRLRSALAELPMRQRSAIALCHYQGLSNKAVAQAMGISIDALESLLARGRKTLSARLRIQPTSKPLNQKYLINAKRTS